MKKQLTKMDLEQAFKALDEIDIPVVKGVKANRLDLKENTKRVDRLELLMEDYYDLNSKDDLSAAAEQRKNEIAKAKLARIEKIVDLDAETEEDILPSYVGKEIIQCPQCMTLFYKQPEDVEVSEEDPTVVNVGERCQHCGNEAGYTLIGKVAADDNTEEATSLETETKNETDVEVSAETEKSTEEETTEETAEEASAENEETSVPSNEDIPMPEFGKNEEETAEESFNISGQSLNEDVESDLDKKLKDHNDYIEYLRSEIVKLESELKKATNNLIKDELQKTVNALKNSLNSALPEEAKELVSGDTLPSPEDLPEDSTDKAEEQPIEEKGAAPLSEGLLDLVNSTVSSLTSNLPDLSEEKDCSQDECDEALMKNSSININLDAEDFGGTGNDVSILENNNLQETDEEKAKSSDAISITDTAIDKLLDSKEFSQPISEAEIDSIINSDDKKIGHENNPENSDELQEQDTKGLELPKEGIDDLEALFDSLEPTADDIKDAEDLNEEVFNKMISGMLQELFANVKGYKLKNCEKTEDKLITEGIINLSSGKNKKLSLEFFTDKPGILECRDSKLADNTRINMDYKIENRTIITENLTYNCKIQESVVNGIVK